MKPVLKFLLLFILTGMSYAGFAQVPDPNSLTPDPQKEKMFSPYVAWRHGGLSALAGWKSQNTVQYYKELWYYSESFYIKRNYLSEGIALDESLIDISRYDATRKQNEETLVTIPGFKDVIVLLPASKLIYKP